MISNSADQLLTERNVSGLNIGRACLDNYKAIIDEIYSQAVAASNQCYEDMLKASNDLETARKIECVWVDD